MDPSLCLLTGSSARQNTEIMASSIPTSAMPRRGVAPQSLVHHPDRVLHHDPYTKPRYISSSNDWERDPASQIERIRIDDLHVAEQTAPATGAGEAMANFSDALEVRMRAFVSGLENHRPSSSIISDASSDTLTSSKVRATSKHTAESNPISMR